MLKRKYILLLVLLLILGSYGSISARKYYEAESYDVTIRIDKGGDLYISEKIKMRFQDGNFSFFFRQIPTEYTGGIYDLKTSKDGKPCPQGNKVDHAEINYGKTPGAKWHINTYSDTSISFELTYRVKEAIRKKDSTDFFFWNVIPYDRSYKIAKVNVEILYPGDVTAINIPYGFTKVVKDGDYNKTLASIDKTDWFGAYRVTIPFENGSLLDESPQWQEKKHNQESYLVPILGITIFFIILGSGFLFFFLKRDSRSVELYNFDQSWIFSPPGTETSVVAYKLAYPSETFKMDWLMASLFHLARKRCVVFENIIDSNAKYENDFLIRLHSIPENLPLHQSKLIDLLFPYKTESKKEIKMSKMIKRFSEGAFYSVQYTNAVKREMENCHFFSTNRESTRSHLLKICAISLILALITFMIAGAESVRFGPYGLIIPICFTSLGVISYVIRHYYSTLNDKAFELGQKWKGYFKYLESVSIGVQNLEYNLSCFDECLPYITVSSNINNWVEVFLDNGLKHAPDYFKSAERGSILTMSGLKTALFTSHLTDNYYQGCGQSSGFGGGRGGGFGGGGGAGGGGSSGAG